MSPVSPIVLCAAASCLWFGPQQIGTDAGAPDLPVIYLLAMRVNTNENAVIRLCQG